VSISSGVDFAEIVCRFRQVIDWGTLEIGSDWKIFTEVENCGREKIEEIEKEDSTEIGRQRRKKWRMEQANCAPGRRLGPPVEEAGRRPDQPACTGVHRKERSTDPGRPTVVTLLSGRSDRPAPVDRLKRICSRVGAVDRAGRPWHGSVDRLVDR